MELFLLLLQIPLLIFIIKYIRKLHSDPLFVNAYYYLLSFKVTAGLVLGVLYFSYYKGEGDTIMYYEHFELLTSICYSNFQEYVKFIIMGEIPNQFSNSNYLFDQERAFTFIKICSPFYILSGSNYWILSIYLSVFSFLGFWILSSTLIKVYKLKPLSVLVSFFIFPSVVFWSSGVIKESLVLGMMCIIISLILNLITRQENLFIRKCIILLVFSCALLYMKFYYFAVLFAVVIPYGLVKYFSSKIEVMRINKSYRIFSFLFLLLLMSIIVSFIHPLLNIDAISEAIYCNYQATLKYSNILNSYTFEGLSSDPISFLSHIPKALFYGLFSPFLWQCKSVITMVNGIENTILLILFITFLLTNFRKEKLVKIDIEVISLVVYVGTLAIFMAFASPNWGSLVRYKVGYLPFFLLLILNNNPAIIQLEKMFSFLNRSEKKS